MHVPLLLASPALNLRETRGTPVFRFMENLRLLYILDAGRRCGSIPTWVRGEGDGRCRFRRQRERQGLETMGWDGMGWRNGRAGFAADGQTFE